MLFGERLRTERKKHHLSAESLAELCGVSRSYITLIENGTRQPGKKILPKLADGLKIKNSTIINWYLEDIKAKLQ